MPEGPEIRRAADEIAAAIAGQEVEEVFFAFEQLKPYEATLAGKRVSAVEARGKSILIHFDNGYTIYSHNQLYGKWLIRPAYDYPNTNRQLRLAIHNRHKSALLYSASDVELLRVEELAVHPFLARLGPDLLNESVTLEQVINRFNDKQFRRRKFTTLLLDQGFLAGPGNYLRSEIMFVGRIHPSLRPADCSAPQIKRVAGAALDLTRQSYRTGGVTNDLAVAEQLKEEGYPYRDYRFRVFNRNGEPCYVCGTPIVKDDIGGRRFYFCPTCQSIERS
jgi:endonuclease-8